MSKVYNPYDNMLKVLEQAAELLGMTAVEAGILAFIRAALS